jgi:hypothetical protein
MKNQVWRKSGLMPRLILGDFLNQEDRNKLIALARDGSAACRVTRRANALVLLDDGWSCQDVADEFLSTTRYVAGTNFLNNVGGLDRFRMGGSASF